MNNKRLNLNSFFPEFENLYKITRDRGLAKIGDSLVNLTYSLAKSIALKRITGKKVPGKILSNALRNSPLRKFAGRKLDSHDLADSVEALIAYSWLKGLISINEISNIMAEAIENNLKLKNEERIASIAFQNLLERIELLLLKEFEINEG
jgi:hypothetical protein